MNPRPEEGVAWADRQIFQAGQSTYVVRDVLDAAHFRNELVARWQELLAQDACEEHARTIGAEADVETLEALCSEYRLARGLESAEETERWLAGRQISGEQFQRYFECGFLLAEHGKCVVPATRSLNVATPAEMNQLRVYLMLSGEFDILARRLGHRIAVRLNTDIPDMELEDLKKTERGRFLNRAGLAEEDLPGWLAHLGRNPEWLEQQIESEAVYRFRCGSALTPENMRRALEGLGAMALVQFEYLLLEVDSENALNEARLCIEFDGVSVEEFARDYRFPCHREHAFYEFLAAPLDNKFLNASVGEVVTLSEDGRHRLFQLVAKTDPTIENPAVQGHLRRRLLGTLLGDLERERVRWL